jgi:transposase-like protein
VALRLRSGQASGQWSAGKGGGEGCDAVRKSAQKLSIRDQDYSLDEVKFPMLLYSHAQRNHFLRKGLRDSSRFCSGVISSRSLRFRTAANFRVGTDSNGCFGGFLAMTLTDLTRLYSTDETCRVLLKKLRWPFGVECVRCKSKDVFEVATQKKYECKECGYQFSVTTQTIFHDTHLPLETWFLAVLLLCEAKKGMSALQLKRTLFGLNKGSYKTVWYMCHRIRAAMTEASRPMLDGKVEVDETYVGGRGHGLGQRGRGTKKEPVIGIRQRGGELRFFHAKDVTGGILENFIRENVSNDLDVLFTDDYSLYRGVAKRLGMKDKHKTIRHSFRIYTDGDTHTNTVESAFSLLKRGIVGTWHKISAKHLQAYCEEMCFRFNRRKRSDLFIDTLRHMVTAPVLTFEKLTA